MLDTVRIYTGFDSREAIGWHVFSQSVIDSSTGLVEIVPINSRINLLAKTDGTNAFSKARFLVPWLNHFSGWAIFVDGVDMMARNDIAEILEFRDEWKAVMVVKHQYKTKNPIKYKGTPLEAPNSDYPRKNWSSVMLINCGHFACRKLTPAYVDLTSGNRLHDFSWVPEDRIGELPKEWNWLVDEYGPNEEAKLLHWTAGIPSFFQYRHAPHSEEWFETQRAAEQGRY